MYGFSASGEGPVDRERHRDTDSDTAHGARPRAPRDLA